MAKKEIITRSITGILIVGITLAAVILSPYSFLAFLLLISFFGMREFVKLGLQHEASSLRIILPIIFSVLLLVCGLTLLNGHESAIIILAIPVLISMIVLFELVHKKTPDQLVRAGTIIYASAAYLLLPLICGTFFLSGPYSFKHILVPVILIWANDVGAYLIGSRFGKKKIAPLISPGKSVEGALGGGVFVLVAAALLWKLWPEITTSYLFLIAFAVPFLSLAGDLWKSSLKRVAGVKDSGNILPGHGGILDRYDSLLYVLPAAALAYHIFVV